MRVRIKRVYDRASRGDGYRVLVDRLWPRGIRKADAGVDEWAKDLAPSDRLRKWFGHEPDKWDEFRQRYRKELEDKKDSVSAVVKHGERRTVTLLFAAKDTIHNNAAVLKEFAETQILGRSSREK